MKELTDSSWLRFMRAQPHRTGSGWRG